MRLRGGAPSKAAVSEKSGSSAGLLGLVATIVNPKSILVLAVVGKLNRIPV